MIKPSTTHYIFAAGREASYVRNQLMISAARSLADVTAITPEQSGPLSTNLLRVLSRLIAALRQPHDLVILGFYSHPLTPIVRRLTRKPILFDAFVSTWDTLCFDRRRFAPWSPAGRAARRLDIASCRAADHILLDTQAHAQFFRDSFDLEPDRIDHWYVGCDESIFHPIPQAPRPAGQPLTVFFYGTYQPLHGVDVIVQAATLLKDEARLHFKLIGDGQMYQQARQLAQQARLTNVDFLAPVPMTTLASFVAESDICLAGPFGCTPKAQRVIPGKTAQFLGMARAIIATDTPANRELLTHRQSAYLCEASNPQALAEAIRTLAHDDALRTSLASAGRQLFEQRLSLPRLIADLKPIIARTLYARSTASN